MITTKAELVKILTTSPVPETLRMLEEQGGGPEDLASAILEASHKLGPVA
jgi:hypothetical protein